jgi:hypothetical protein
MTVIAPETPSGYLGTPSGLLTVVEMLTALRGSAATAYRAPGEAG